MSTRFKNQEGWLGNVAGELYVVSKNRLKTKANFKTSFGYYHKVFNGWESFSGWYWFQLSKTDKNNNCFGFVQGFSAEFGLIEIGEIKKLIPSYKIWSIGRINLPYSGITEKPKDWFYPLEETVINWWTDEQIELFKLVHTVDIEKEEVLTILGYYSYPLDKKKVSLEFKGETFGSYIVHKDTINVTIANDEIFKQAIRNFKKIEG